MKLTSIEICAGAGGQALGLEHAGFDHERLVEIDHAACATLRLNRPKWEVIEGDLRQVSMAKMTGIDLFAGGVPCPPFSKAGKQLGANDERDMFPEALRMVGECRPQAVMLENVKGLLDAVFQPYREKLLQDLLALGYEAQWKLLHASDYGVPQLRPRAILVGLRKEIASGFSWPSPNEIKAPTVGRALWDLMIAQGWRGAMEWKKQANTIAPTLVGGSKKHGGPDLGPTRARQAWAVLGVDGRGVANEPPVVDFSGMPRLTIRMAARIQGFPDEWMFSGGKTAAYRQIGNAFPPPVACAVGKQIKKAIEASARRRVKKVA